MQHLSDRSLLLLWEQGLSQSLIEKSLRLIVHTFPGLDIQTAAALSIGDRDARLLRIRKALFFFFLQNATHCPACGEKIEWEMPVSGLELQTIQPAAERPQLEFQYQNKELVMRLPNTMDVLEAIELESPEEQSNSLLQRCILRSSLPFERVEDYPESLKSDILHQMESLDPQANIEIQVQCPACQHAWNMLFDIMNYLWTEIGQLAHRLLQDVFLLARSFGWPEAEILAMSRTRRNWYIQMLQS